MKKEEENKLKEKARKSSIIEGSWYSVMESFGLRYITPYAIAMQMSNFLIGVLSSLPSLLGSLSQIKGSTVIEKFSRKKIIIVGAILQALMWLPILLVGYAYFFFSLSTFYASILLILFYTLLILFGAFFGPAWNSWMKDIIPSHMDSYFGKRASIVGTVGLISTFIAGFLLNYFQKTTLFYGFLLIFSIAFVGRAISVYLFKRQYEPRLKKAEGYYFSFFQFVKKMSNNNFGNFVIFTTFMLFAVAIASPFFTVYMLEDLNFSYLFYTIIITVPAASTLVFLPLWGKFGDKYGDIKVIKFCGFFIFVIPLLWMAAPLFNNQKILLIYLVLVEILSGFVWSGFNLTTGTFIFNAVSKERLPLCIAYSTVLNSFGVFVGAMIGGYVSSLKIPIFGLKSIFFIFLASSIMRLIVYFAFIGKIKEVRKVQDFEILKLKNIFTKILPKHSFDNEGIKRF